MLKLRELLLCSWVSSLGNGEGGDSIMRGIGAIVFLVVFFAFLLMTLGVPDLPIGRQLYGLFGVAESDYPVLGMCNYFGFCCT
jgi:hypothetical protein